MDLLVRCADVSDAAAIAALHVRAWQWAYAGLIPTAYLDSLSARLPDRERVWQARLGQPAPAASTWVAEHAERIVGFASIGRSRDADATAETGEVGALYLEPAVVGTGVGRALFARAADELRRLGFRIATLWVLETNARARRFYEAAGWRSDGASKTENIGGVDVVELRYRSDLGR
jgi:GNAT superfamily N-acetyltransferase